MGMLERSNKGEPMKMGYNFEPNVVMKNKKFTHLWNFDMVKRQFLEIYVVVVMIFFLNISVI